MKRCFLLLIFFLPSFVEAQKVGLVLSGGAAKGLAHVGVLKALEENEIPIDYLVGTSMGGIIAGCYSAGMSPEEIEEMVLSDDFLRWVNGSPETGFNYFYHKNEPNPGFLRINLSFDSTLDFHLNSTIANDVSLNFALAEKTAQASAISNNNFDSLFVPLRVVAADIFTQSEVIFSKGSLADALRATQTVPFFYQPIRVEGKYLFDGGVYNNFPVDVMQEQFKPAVIIGVNVSTKIFEEYPYGNDEKLIGRSLLYLLLDKSDPSRITSEGIFIQPNLKGYTSFDFNRAKSLIDSGYAQTIRQIEEIRSKVGERRTCDNVCEDRNKFRNRSRAPLFEALTFEGFNSKQRKYIQRIFRRDRKDLKPLHAGDIKKGYFKLVSEEYFSNVYPRITYSTSTNAFNLNLTRRPQQNFHVDFGGVIATRDISNIYLGFNYYYFKRTLSHVGLGFQSGNFYKSAVAKTRIDFPLPVYLEPYAEFNQWNYLVNGDLFQNVAPYNPTVLKRINRKVGANIGVPVKSYFKAVVNAEGFSNSDRFINGSSFISTDTLDRLRLKGIRAGLEVSANSLNRKQYASAGKRFSVSASFFNVREIYQPGNTSVSREFVRQSHQWLRLRASAEQYFNAGWFRPGFFAEGVFSNQPVFKNYFGTVINAPAFQPLQDTRTLMLENFRSFNYIAAGIRNVFTLRHKVDLRVEGCLFKPFDFLQENPNNETVISNDLKVAFFTGSAGLVYHSPVGPVSLSLNYYDDSKRQLGVLLHIGFLLFNNHSLAH